MPVLVLVTLLVAFVSQIPRDGRTSAPAAGTASISGRITDKETGQPIAEAVVQLRLEGTPEIVVIADAEGRYELTGLVAGEYTLWAGPPEGRATHLVQVAGQAPGLAQVRRPTIKLAAAQRRTGEDLALSRSLAIEGRVVNAFDEPLADVEVLVVRLEAARTQASAHTDDRGEYRVFGLQPGRYRVRASAHHQTVDVALNEEPLVTWHPSSATEDTAADVVLGSRDASGIDIRIQQSRTHPSRTVGLAAGGQTVASDKTGAIRGTVVDRESRRPLAQAVVQIRRRDQTLRRSVSTDPEGGFAFIELEPGQYSVRVQPGEHLGAYLDTTLEGDPDGIDVRSGQTRELRIELRRALAITARVVDESGEPLAGFHVMVRDSVTGNPPDMRPRFTDDRGHLRVYGLRPGRYTVCADGLIFATIDRRATPRRERLLRTCHPGSSTEASAQAVRLADIDVGPIEIRMRRGSTFTISGTVIGASNPAAALQVGLQRFESGGTSVTTIATQPDGRFDLLDLPAGEYAISAHAVSPENPRERSPREAAFLPITLVDDIPDLVIPLARTIDVPGRVRVEDGSVPLPQAAPGAMPMVVITEMAGPGPAQRASWESAFVMRDRTFMLKGLFGSRRVIVTNLPKGWFVKSITYDARDITDEAVDFKAARGEFEVVLSSRGAVVTGKVLDDRGRPLRGGRVLLFKADSDMTAHAPYVEAVASDGGAFRFLPQRSGDYVVVALAPGTQIPQWHQPDRLTALREAGDRITLAGEGEITVNLTALRK